MAAEASSPYLYNARCTNRIAFSARLNVNEYFCAYIRMYMCSYLFVDVYIFNALCMGVYLCVYVSASIISYFRISLYKPMFSGVILPLDTNATWLLHRFTNIRMLLCFLPTSASTDVSAYETAVNINYLFCVACLEY